MWEIDTDMAREVLPRYLQGNLQKILKTQIQRIRSARSSQICAHIFRLFEKLNYARHASKF